MTVERADRLHVHRQRDGLPGRGQRARHRLWVDPDRPSIRQEPPRQLHPACRRSNDDFVSPASHAGVQMPRIRFLPDWSRPEPRCRGMPRSSSPACTAVVSLPPPNAAGSDDLGPVTVTIDANDDGGPLVASITYSADRRPGTIAPPPPSPTPTRAIFDVSNQGVTTVSSSRPRMPTGVRILPQTVHGRAGHDRSEQRAPRRRPTRPSWNCCSGLVGHHGQPMPSRCRLDRPTAPRAPPTSFRRRSTGGIASPTLE